MALHLDDRWVWDFWLVREGVDHHVFYLQAAHAIGHPDERHWNVSVGHAVSQDLRRWQVLPDALHPGPPGSWDDASTWTGSVVRHRDLWHLLYTGTSHADGRLVQRVGLATSPDLVTWTRTSAPVLEADPRWYETLDLTAWHDQAWRDPWVFLDERDGWFHALLTARAASGPAPDRGVVGHARSTDLVTWEVLPPVTDPMGFGQLEVPQVFQVGRRWYLLFCSDLETQGERRRAEGAGTGTYYLVGDSPTGPFEQVGDGVLAADRNGSTYAGKLHRDSSGELVFLAWHRTGADGDFHGALSDPRPVRVGTGGSLHLD
jgi:beta-fructofuranosidase